MTGATSKQISRTYILWAWFVYACEVIMFFRSSTSSITSLLREKANSIIRKPQQCLLKLKSAPGLLLLPHMTRKTFLFCYQSHDDYRFAFLEQAATWARGSTSLKVIGNTFLAGSPLKSLYSVKIRIKDTFGCKYKN